MPGKSDYLENGLLNHVFRAVAFPTISGVHIALHTADPTDAGTGTEVSGGSYARVAVTRNTSNWDAPVDASGAQRIVLNTVVTFPSPTANWGTVTHVGIWDAATTGNLLYSAALTTSRTINNGDGAPSFADGAITIDES
jgi:hypothetical protein